MTPREIVAQIDARVAESRRAFHRQHPRADALWTEEDEVRLTRSMARGATFRQAARLLGRTEDAIRARWAELLRYQARLRGKTTKKRRTVK